MKQLAVSVIIPVYNSEEFITDAIESLVKQPGMEEAEVLLIDDGSTDSTPAVCDRLAEQYSNLVVIHQENKGPSAARNIGLDRAKGKYIAFVDADDVADEKMISTLVEMMENGADLAVAGYCLEFVYRHRSVKEYLYPQKGVFSVDEKFGQVCCQWYARHILTTLCNKLYRRDLIEQYHLRMNEDMSLSEDLFWNIQYLKCVKQVVSTDQNVYYYRIRKNKTTVTHRFDPMHIHMQMEAAEEMIAYLGSIGYYGNEVYYLSLKYITSSLSNIYYAKGWNRGSRHYFAELVIKEPLVKKLADQAEVEGIFAHLLVGWYRRGNVTGIKILLRLLYVFRRYFHVWQRRMMKKIKN